MTPKLPIPATSDKAGSIDVRTPLEAANDAPIVINMPKLFTVYFLVGITCTTGGTSVLDCAWE